MNNRSGLSGVRAMGMGIASAILVFSAPAQAATATGFGPGTRPEAGVPRVASVEAATGGSLEVFYSDIGNLRLSVDAVGTNAESATVQAERPAGATVKKAFLFAASTGSSGVTPADGSVSIDGAPVSWDPAHTISNGIGSVNVAADVTSLLKAKLETAPAGQIDFTVAETNTYDMDGEILAVVWNDASAKSRSIYLMYGAQSTTGDHFTVGLSEPLKPSSIATMALGISYGFQPAGQYSQVDVNSVRLTTAAGGQDDGEGENGALITVGGLGDSTDNPADPMATDSCGDAGSRCDDELYDLKSLVGTGATSFDVDTLNPSNDDNIMFAAFEISGVTATVGNSVSLSPSGTTQQVGTQHTVVAVPRDANGNMVMDRPVTIRVTSGPNSGATLTGIRTPDGRVVATYGSGGTGVDSIEASYVDADGATHTSNVATQKWTPSVVGTFGGAWPFNGSNLELRYTYGGGHRYLGNVVQGASNWNAAGTKVRISQWPGAPLAIQLPIQDVYRNDSWWGMTIFGPDDCVYCGYTSNPILLNQRTLDAESDAQRTKVATHELGHALGLRHPQDFNLDDSTPSLMWQGLLRNHTRATPQAVDVSRVNGMYP